MRLMHYLRMPGVEILCGAPMVPHADITRDLEHVTCPACIELLAEQVTEAIEDSALDPFTRDVKRAIRGNLRGLLDEDLVAAARLKDIKLDKNKLVATIAVRLQQPVHTITFELVPPDKNDQ